MHSPKRDASTPLLSAQKARRPRPVEDVIYQVVTVGAILLVIGTLWLF